MAKGIKINIEELKRFSQKLEKAANAELKKQYAIWLEALGLEFLDVVQDEIIRLGVVDTRRLLNSFDKSDSECVFEMNNQGLSLVVGTNVEYAAWSNDGHWLNPKGQEKRWVPGHWTNKGFQYDKSSKTGMLLKQRWIEGYHYFDISKVVFEKILAVSMEKKVYKWLNEL